MKALLVMAAFFCSCSWAILSFQVEPKSSDCFHADLKSGQQVKITFWISRGGLLDIDLRVNGPYNEQIYSGMQFETSQFEFMSRTPGPHSICFNNEMSRWTAKFVEFEIEIDGKKEFYSDKKSQQEEFLTPGVLTPVEHSLGEIDRALETIRVDLMYLRGRESAHRDTAESTNERVLWYSVIESLVLVTISLGQVYYLRKFFEVKRAI